MEVWSRERSLRFLEDLKLEVHGTHDYCSWAFHTFGEDGTWGKAKKLGNYHVTGDLSLG